MPPSVPPTKRRFRGFEPASSLLRDRIRSAGESRGFAVTRLLTGWAEIVGEDLARMTRPVKMSYPRDGFGATLTLLVRSAHAPMVEMQKPRLIGCVNACYGYAAISRVHLTQTAPTGFAGGEAEFGALPKAPAPPDPAIEAEARTRATGVADDGLRAALENLTRSYLTRTASTKKGR
ncbi:DUF721 domain-containing protein [Falsirhodobacter sp. 20TX0035]|uniref:DUF721 domain-containing protein n=1 Tax=Falsirhodobacter sp. 20TX0035 TaxID=3022019 RepID=UPI0023311A8A|nr:DUF721 domain-containing protein [Falsirhodobacter sp. 20TX0035]MDB6452568.1 DUF721 domain-containing protein [Falsirhodobacter sp. 20TX0035]